MNPARWTESQIEDFNERAAILEYDAGMTRAEAEAKAAKIVEGE